MGYTPIRARRVLAAFGFASLVAVLPFFVIFRSDPADNLLGSIVPEIAFAAAAAGLLWLAVRVGRQVVRRPFRA